MRFLHTADWHIGRRLHGFDLTDEARNAFDQIEQIAKEEKVDGIVIAGDLYDRSLPSEQSVGLLNQMLQQLNLKDHLPIYAISGNHDSATRLATGSPWYRDTNLYINTKLLQAFQPIENGDTQLFLLPYFEPFDAKEFFDDDDINDLATAFSRIVEKMKSEFDPKKKHVLVAHFFAAGSSHTDSETQLTVGGLSAVPVDLMKDFDYVALGHLHGKDAIHQVKIQYSGSPLKFSLSEAQQNKGVWIVDSDRPEQRQFKPIVPIHDVKKLTGSFKELTSSDYYHNLDLNDFYGITLTDLKPIPNVLVQLRKIYPYMIELKRLNGYHPGIENNNSSKVVRQQDPLSLLNHFYQSVAKESLTDQQLKWAKETLRSIEKEGK